MRFSVRYTVSAKIKTRILSSYGSRGPGGRYIPPSHVPTFCLGPSGTTFSVPWPYGYSHWCMGGIRMHTYRCHMGVIGVPEVKKSIFPLWSGIALGWLKWPKNTPKRSKMRLIGHPGATRGHNPCQSPNAVASSLRTYKRRN